MSKAFESVKEFHQVFGHPIDKPLTEKMAQFRFDLITEEYKEVFNELYDFKKDERIPADWINKAALTLELADMLYVIYGFAVAAGLPLDEAFDAKHQSNMSKLGEDGKPIYREDGKVLKGPGFKPANINHLF